MLLKKMFSLILFVIILLSYSKSSNNVKSYILASISAITKTIIEVLVWNTAIIYLIDTIQSFNKKYSKINIISFGGSILKGTKHIYKSNSRDYYIC